MSEADIIMLFTGLAAGALAGVIAGVLAGLAGIGGGLIYVPVFYACLPHDSAGVSLSVFISLLAIVLTGGFSAKAHNRLGHINHVTAVHLLPGLVVGASIGLMLTLHLPEALVLAGLAVLDAWIAWDYGRPMGAVRGRASLWLASFPIGYVSGSLGIGGGTMLVPLLRRSLPLRMAVGTSVLCGTLMAAAALLVNGLLIPAWRPLLLGQLWFALGVLAAVLLVLPRATQWSARLHASLGEEELRLLLKGVFAVIAAMMALSAIYEMLHQA
ncbi:MAG TPA: sulfite exporter TauE/SafE family protein [Zetaproteobacteria bacterium]|nr:sulfite exporter TauE/SafE family protein [Zetaproteobacteria bacterium]